MKALGWWLILVGSLRLASVWFGFFDIWALRLAVFSKTTMTEVHGRTFGVWTLLTCTLCFLCALNLDNKPLYTVTFLSFIYAFGHFLTEYLIYQTMAISNLTTVGIFAGIGLNALGFFLVAQSAPLLVNCCRSQPLIMHYEVQTLRTSIIWMLLQWNSHGKSHVKHS